jgi:hypothetical protein
MAKKQTTKKSEVTAEKKATPKKATPKKAIRKFEAGQMYTFRGNGIAPSLKKGMEYKVTAQYAEHFIKNGYGEIID